MLHFRYPSPTHWVESLAAADSTANNAIQNLSTFAFMSAVSPLSTLPARSHFGGSYFSF